MNKLVEEIIKPILEANSKITKVVGIFGGRFQPFGPHHKKAYEWLSKQFDEAYITTSNIKKLPRHPMDFKEKVRHMTKMGVPKSKIIMEKSPFVAKNLEKKFDKDTTAFVYIFGKKDTGRLGGKYFQDYKKNKNNLKGYKEHGYYLVAPHMSVSAGGMEVSGTAMRELLGSDKYKENREKLFKKMFGYFNDGVFQMMTNKFSKIFENVVTWDNTKEKPKNKKHFDGEDRDLLHDTNFKKALKKLKIPTKLLNNKNELVKYLTSNPQVMTQLLRLVTEVDLPIKVGDTVRMGKFKNKKVVVKKIEWNEKGDLLINGRPALKFRLEKKAEVEEGYPNEEDMKKIRKRVKKARSKSDSSKEYQYHPIDEFLTTIDMSQIIKEISSGAGSAMTDDGPSAMMYGKGGYFGRNKEWAEKLGFEVVNYILDVDVSNVPPFKSEFGGGKSVSYLPAGIGTGKTPNNPENLTGAKGYNKWVKNMKKIAQEVGFKLMKFKDEKETKNKIAKDTKETLKQQKSDEKDIKDIKVEESVFSQDWWEDLIEEQIVTKTQLKPRGKELLLMGGAYGHMAHPFDDKDLTFGDLKKIITDGLGGQLNREDNVTEKLDGQNIMISWKDGKLIAARNKGHIKNGGKTALDAKGIASKFKGRGNIADAFNFAMKDLGKSIGTLSDKQKEKIFNNGYNFMNLEVMWPKSANVIDYDVAELIFHGALIYDDKGNVKGEVKGSGRILAGMIKQINQHIGKKYSISKPVFLTIPKHQDFGKKKDKFLGRLSKLRAEYGLKDNDTLGLYHQMWWEHKIYQTFGIKNLSGKLVQGLTKRWAFFDKSYSVADIKKDMKRFIEANPKKKNITQEILDFDKKNHAAQVKQNMKPFEVLFFEVGAEILKNVQGFIAANPDKAVQNIKKNLSKAISTVKSGGDIKKLKTLKLQLDKLNTIGGVDAIVPSEGIVFKYKGKTYKFTGAFAPINQITGLIYF